MCDSKVQVETNVMKCNDDRFCVLLITKNCCKMNGSPQFYASDQNLQVACGKSFQNVYRSTVSIMQFWLQNNNLFMTAGSEMTGRQNAPPLLYIDTWPYIHQCCHMDVVYIIPNTRLSDPARIISTSSSELRKCFMAGGMTTIETNTSTCMRSLDCRDNRCCTSKLSSQSVLLSFWTITKPEWFHKF